jgi:hypothetical protein
MGGAGPQASDRRRDVRHQARVPANGRFVRLVTGVGERALGRVQQPLHRLHLATDERPEGLEQAQPRPGAHHLRRQQLQPPAQGRVLAASQHRLEVPLDQPGGPGQVGGGSGVTDGVVGQPLLLRPGGRRPVQLQHPLGLLALQPGAKQVSEQLVVAPPAPHLVQGDQEQVGPLDLLQQCLAVAAAGGGIRQRPADPVKDRGLQQEPAQLTRLAVQDLLGEVVEYVAVAAREGPHEGVDVEVALERERGQLQPRDPAFGARLQRGHGRIRQLHPDRGAQQRGRLLAGEAQVGLPQLGQLPAGPQPGQRQGWVGPAGQHQPQPRRRMLQQQFQRLVNRRSLDQVIVVQDQHDRLGHIGQLVDQGGHHHLERGRQAAGQRGDPFRHPGSDRVQSGGDVAPEAGWVVVAGVQRQPGHRSLAGVSPVSQQGGLAEPGRGADQHQLAAHALAQAVQQSWPRHQTRPRPRDVQLGRQQDVALMPGSRGWHRGGRLSHRDPPAQPVRRSCVAAASL